MSWQKFFAKGKTRAPQERFFGRAHFKDLYKPTTTARKEERGK